MRKYGGLCGLCVLYERQFERESLVARSGEIVSIGALIFDFDGLILDTESPSLRCWEEIYGSYGLTFPVERWLAGLGCAVRAFDAYAHLVGLVGPGLTMEVLRARRRAREVELVNELPLCPGVRAYLEAARGMGLKMAVASSSSRGWVEGHLVRHGVRAYFDVLVCKEDTERHKPDPAPYLAALERLGVEAGAALALEDSPNGIAAAQAAGLLAVAVPNAITRRLDLSGADLRVENLAELRLVDLAAYVAGRVAGGG
jgi:HAD superfamily hydrolase (TIGR01509 family)